MVGVNGVYGVVGVIVFVMFDSNLYGKVMVEDNGDKIFNGYNIS